MGELLHAAGYRFVGIDEPAVLRASLQARCEALRLRGTVLVAPEGINFGLAGAAADLHRWLAELRADPRFAGLAVHESRCHALPYARLKLKLKAEIIRMAMPLPAGAARAPALPPATLARWLAQGRDDDGRELVLLDTRNAFEVDAGRFDGALDWRLGRFGDFPRRLAAEAAALRGKAVVSYCTGGIRCEKAARALQAAGLQASWQLDGGILGYFRATGGQAPGWHGRCVVFDERGAVAPAEFA